MSIRFVIPNLFTAASFLLGIGSVLMSATGELELAAWFILWCVLLDKVDGTAARLLKATSRFGFEFDSFADLVAFGIAPAFLAYQIGRGFWAMGDAAGPATALVVVAAFYSLMAAVRLARFNAVGTQPGMRFFQGVPTTFSGGCVATTVLLVMRYRLQETIWSAAFLAFLILLGMLMVSRLPLPKLQVRRNKAFNLFQIANIVVVYVTCALRIWPEYFAALIVIYLLVGLVYGQLRHPAGAAGEAAGEAPTHG